MVGFDPFVLESDGIGDLVDVGLFAGEEVPGWGFVGSADGGDVALFFLTGEAGGFGGVDGEEDDVVVFSAVEGDLSEGIDDAL